MPPTTPTIELTEACTHNLQGVSLSLPRHKLVVFTGVSGSGKSSLVFDTLYAEGQRRYVESLNTYARQLIGQQAKPDVKSLTGLSPAIAIDQKSASGLNRSTVGTVTEVLDYCRVLFARIGQPHCPACGSPIFQQSQQQLLAKLLSLPQGTKLQLLAPVVRGRKGDYNALFHHLRKEGYARAWVDGHETVLDELPDDYRLERHKVHHIEVVIDRLIIKATDALTQRLQDALTKALKKGDGFVVVHRQAANATQWSVETHSKHLACTVCEGVPMTEMAPRLFSFNSPYGACPTCQGTGFSYEVDEAQLVPDPALTLAQGALAPLKKLLGRSYRTFCTSLAKAHGVRVNVAYNKLTQDELALVLYGDAEAKRRQWLPRTADAPADEGDDSTDTWADLLETFEGVVPALKRRFEQASGAMRRYLQPFFKEQTCPACQGARLNPQALGVVLGGLNLHQLCELPVPKALATIKTLGAGLDDTQRLIAHNALRAIEQRLHFLTEVGLDYLSLSRRANTLSGGEAQRIRLASQLGSGLSGVLYVLDEPTIGLHPYNNQQLIATLKRLRDQGNCVLVVEHDEDMIREADWLVDIGPMAGKHGGECVAQGTPTALLANPQASPHSLTVQHLAGNSLLGEFANRTPRPVPAPKAKTGWLHLNDVHQHNLNHVTLSVPLNTLTCVTGMSGSGKSTLVFKALLQAMRHRFTPEEAYPAQCGALVGAEALERLVVIDQTPIGRTSRSTPATYANLWDSIRNVFANTALAKTRAYKPSQFSFNVKGGRCDVCKGSGVQTLQMKLLPDAQVVCPSCNGKRFLTETLEVRYNGLSIYDVLCLTVEEARDVFADIPKLADQLGVLAEIGLDYITLGQSATTLSGGEAQRLKLATELMNPSRLPTLYLLDEPTIGLHWHDLAHLLKLLHQLVDQGHTVLTIEHHLDLVKAADYVIDLGPMGGEAGGNIVATGSPAQVAKEPASLTGRFL
jgi:excinuclease ABC subunit A